jgi:hypothetical protein
MPQYGENRRTDKVPRLNAISNAEGAEATDLRRSERYEKEIEKRAAEANKEKNPPKRSFKDLVKK